MADRDALRGVPPRQRALLALLLAPVGLALLVGGVLVAVGASGGLVRSFGALLAVLALGLLGVAHGLFWSARRDRAEQQLDRVLEAAAGSVSSCSRDCLTACGSTDCAVQALPRS